MSSMQAKITFKALSVATLGVLTACATAPVIPPTVAGPRPATGTRLDVNKALLANGWRHIADSGPVNDANAIFLKPTTYSVTGDVTRISSYIVYGNEATRTIGNYRSVTYQWEINCKQRSARIVASQTFFDPYGDKPLVGRTYDDSKFAPAAQSSLSAVVQSRVCESGRSSGTGIVVANERVLTASHVVDRCVKLEALFDGKRYPARIAQQDRKNDLGILEVTGLASGKTLAIRNAAVNGESVLVSGYPLAGLLSSDLTVTTGIVNSLAGLGNNTAQIQISAQVSPGNSGGSLIDKSGNLVGVVVSKLDVLRLAAITGDLAQNVNFAVKPDVVNNFLETSGIRLNRVDASVRLESEELAQRARGFTVKIECASRPPSILAAAD